MDDFTPFAVRLAAFLDTLTFEDARAYNGSANPRYVQDRLEAADISPAYSAVKAVERKLDALLDAELEELNAAGEQVWDEEHIPNEEGTLPAAFDPEAQDDLARHDETFSFGYRYR